jgi:hypothetical protein
LQHGLFDAAVSSIEEAEAFPMGRAINFAIEAGARVLVLLCDNQAVNRAFFKGYSRAQSIESSIVGVRFRVVSAFLVIVFVDIPTEENFADIDTRPDHSYSEKDRRFRGRTTAERGWLGFEVWKTSAKRYFHRDDLSVL